MTNIILTLSFFLGVIVLIGAIVIAKEVHKETKFKPDEDIRRFS